ncbi:MAG: hypothetical protein GY830_06880 [Bacteroidetes bacterium]|nr:hypothetical protein [Bacteroidota bacterium]
MIFGFQCGDKNNNNNKEKQTKPTKPTTTVKNKNNTQSKKQTNTDINNISSRKTKEDRNKEIPHKKKEPPQEIDLIEVETEFGKTKNNEEVKDILISIKNISTINISIKDFKLGLFLYDNKNNKIMSFAYITNIFSKYEPMIDRLTRIDQKDKDYGKTFNVNFNLNTSTIIKPTDEFQIKIHALARMEKALNGLDSSFISNGVYKIKFNLEYNKTVQSIKVCLKEFSINSYLPKFILISKFINSVR